MDGKKSSGDLSRAAPVQRPKHLNNDTEAEAVNTNAGLLDASMNHIIDTSHYVMPCDDNFMNESVMIDPQNPFDEETVEHFLSSLRRPLNTYPNYHIFLSMVAPSVAVRSSVDLGTILPL